MNGLTAPKAILFDWDNTLVDNWASIAGALNATMAEFDRPKFSEMEVRRMVRRSMRNSFPRMFGDRWNEARDIFYANFRTDHLAMLKPLSGTSDLLKELVGMDVILGVVSNKGGESLRRALSHLEWADYFNRSVGAVDAVTAQPEVEPVDLALADSGIERPRAVWFIGDAAVDLECGIRAGCTPILRISNDEPAEAYKDWPPAAVVNSSEDILRLVVKSR